MKIFISHKFRGVDKKDLREKLEKISNLLEGNHHRTFIYFRDKTNWQPKNFPPGKVIKEAFQEIKKCDTVLAFIDSAKMSEGMMLEIGFAKALNKKIILLTSQKHPSPTLEAISDKIIKFSDFKNLNKKATLTRPLKFDIKKK